LESYDHSYCLSFLTIYRYIQKNKQLSHTNQKMQTMKKTDKEINGVQIAGEPAN